MTMIPVVSSNIASIGYENGTLYVRFNNGSLYSYSGVPEYVFDSLLNANSKGGYLAAHIKGRYPYNRIS